MGLSRRRGDAEGTAKSRANLGLRIRLRASRLRRDKLRIFFANQGYLWKQGHLRSE